MDKASSHVDSDSTAKLAFIPGKVAKKKLRRLTKDDGYCSYTSTPISCGERQVLCGLIRFLVMYIHSAPIITRNNQAMNALSDTAAIERLSGGGSHTQVVLVDNSLSNATGHNESSPTDRASVHKSIP